MDILYLNAFTIKLVINSQYSVGLLKTLISTDKDFVLYLSFKQRTKTASEFEKEVKYSCEQMRYRILVHTCGDND